ncbi:MAG: monooxygenase [Sphingobium sp.]|uniref:styrene monooxygenase subunit StyA n=1 Tax=Sphingomonas melonis TaxID=152682 RepID=UPI0003622168|nr:styrene monooxygenase/indole monooxygenase family protein [Sphingomonas melonis]MBS47051.1 monooxygenase [Sphingobium sp.]
MTKSIGIVGAGTAGLHLGLHLIENGVEATIYTDRRPEEYASMRLLNTVAHHHVTVSREDKLGVNHWPDAGYAGHYYYIGGPQPLEFYGKLEKPSRAVDYRIYQPALMEDFAARGGTIVYEPIAHEDLPELSEKHDLIVICTGKGPFGQMFAHEPAYSPFDRPQRALCVGLYKGIRETETRAVTMFFSPGQGEMIEIPTLSFDGMVTALVMENHIGGDLEILAKTKYDDDPKAFIALLLEKLKKHYPTCYERIDLDTFDLANGPLDILQGGVTPTVRASYTRLSNGKLAVALGDVQAVVDPVLGQGANMASYAGVVLGEEIVANEVFDERFMEKVDARRRDRVLSATRWTNYILRGFNTLAPELLQFIGAISQNPPLADEFTENFNFPEKQWDCFSSPERVQRWIEQRLSVPANDAELTVAAE